jgi:hypothetical protein
MKSFDLKKTHKDLYTANSKIKEVEASKATFLVVEDRGEPGGPAFEAAIGALYGVAYTTKFSLKTAGTLDFGVPNAECVWLFDDPGKTPKTKWTWRLQIRIPDQVTGRHVAAARKAIEERKGVDASKVKRATFSEGRCLQTMHVGPYDEVGETYERLAERATELGLDAKGPGHEIYISDPRRTRPERLKTIVRMPVRKAAKGR